MILLISSLVIKTSARSKITDSNDKPNIVFILADDLGWSDLGCFGSMYFVTELPGMIIPKHMTVMKGFRNELIKKISYSAS